MREELRSLASADQTHRNERDAWENLIDERNDALDEQCATLTTDSGWAIRAGVKRYADAGDFVERLKQAVTGSRVPGNKIEGLGGSISGADTPVAASSLWRGMLADLERLAEFDEETDGADKRPDAPVLSSAGLTAANLDGIGRSLKSDGWLSLSLTPIKSEPVFEYQAREQEVHPVSECVGGAASHGTLENPSESARPTLIIDQPEEDLDNPVMLEIV